MARASKIILLTFGIPLLLSACTDDIGDRYVGFAQCLTDKKVVMYGAYWCPHCANQKALFGREGFEKIKYVECDPRGRDANPKLCLEKKVEGYPTWEFPDGSFRAGEMSLEALSKKSTCPLPELPANTYG